MNPAGPTGRDSEDVPRECTTLDRLFAWREGRTPHAMAYRQFDAANGRWGTHTWRDVGLRIRLFKEAFATLSIARGARIAVLLHNGVDAVCVDQAALACACVPVPLHALDNPQSIAYILADSGATLLFVEDEAQWNAIAALGVGMPGLRWVVVTSRPSVESPLGGIAPAVMSLDGFLAISALSRTRTSSPEPTQPDELAAIVYTSGTTGRPKGVMLTHANVMANVRATLRRVAAYPDDELLSFLPLSHTFERTVGYYLPIAAGACVAYARSVADLAEDLRRIRPTILVSVPRIYERVQVQIDAALRAAPLRRTVFHWATRAGWRRFQHATGLRRVGLLSRLVDASIWPLLDRVAAAPLRAQFGGRLRLAVSGGAPLSPSLAHVFIGLGVPIVQGYGMTETAPVVACNAPDDNDPATVGRVLEGVEVRIGNDKELLVRGPSVMRGYWKRDADTANVFVDGWLRTGDQAAIEDGRVRILGRDQGNPGHVDGGEGRSGGRGTGHRRRPAVRTGGPGRRGASVHCLHRRAESRALGRARILARARRLRARELAGSGSDRISPGSHATSDDAFPGAVAAQAGSPDPRAVDDGEHAADADLEAQAPEPRCTVLEADLGALRASMNAAGLSRPRHSGLDESIRRQVAGLEPLWFLERHCALAFGESLRGQERPKG